MSEILDLMKAGLNPMTGEPLKPTRKPEDTSVEEVEEALDVGWKIPQEVFDWMRQEHGSTDFETLIYFSDYPEELKGVLEHIKAQTFKGV